VKDIKKYIDLPIGAHESSWFYLLKSDNRIRQLIVAMLSGCELTINGCKGYACLNGGQSGRYEELSFKQGVFLVHMKSVIQHSGNLETGEEHYVYWNKNKGTEVGRLLLIETLSYKKYEI